MSYDLTTGLVADYPGIVSAGDYTYPVSTSFEANSFVTAVGPSSAAITTLRPAIAVSDTFAVSGAGPNQVVRLSDSLYLATFHHVAAIHSLDGTQLRWSGRVEGSSRVVQSPDGRFATILAFSGAFDTTTVYGVPGFNALTGDSLFILPLISVKGAEFTTDGAQLFIVGGTFPHYDSLRVVNTGTGSVAATIVLPDSMLSFGLLLDASAGMVYVAAEFEGNAEVLVYDMTTLEFLARLPTRMSCGQFCDGTMALDQRGNRLYLVGEPGGLSSPVFTFDLLEAAAISAGQRKH